MSVICFNEFKSSHVTISAPKTLQSGAKQAYLNYDGGKMLMQTAQSMTVPFGLNCADKFGPPEYSVDLSFRGHEQNPEIKQFMETVMELDKLMVEHAVKNSKLLFKKELTQDVVKEFYTPMLKYSKDKEGNVTPYPPNIRLKLRKNENGEFMTSFYNPKGELYDKVPVEELLTKGVQVTAIMECGGVWFAGSKFGLTWRAKQVVVHALPKKLGAFAFKGMSSALKEVESKKEEKEDEDEEDEDEEEDEKDEKKNEFDDDVVFKTPQKPSVMSMVMPSPSPASVVAEDAEQGVNDEDGDDVEPIPVPKKSLIKKKVVAKK
jgi:hypothetical protein